MSATMKKKAAAPAIADLQPNTPVPGIAAELQALQRQRSVVLKSRNMQANRLQAVVAGTLGYSAAMPEKERRKKFAEAAALIKAVAESGDDSGFNSVIRTTLIGIDAFNALKDTFEREMVRLARRLPVAAWVQAPQRRGFGLLFLAIVVGEAGDLSDYANPAKLWRRMGCAPWSFGGKTLMAATWRSGKEGKLPASEWESYGYSPRRRSIAYLIGEGIVKQNTVLGGSADAYAETDSGSAAAVPGPYRLRYDEAKARARELHPEYSDLRCHRHAMLLATKRLLRDLWVEWHSLAGGSGSVTEATGAG